MDYIVKNKLTVLISLATLFATPVMATSPVKEKLTVYTYGSFASEWGPGPKIEANFEKVCNCDLEFVALDDGVSVLNRLRLEGKNSQADVILGLDDSLITTAKNTGLLSKHNIDLSPLSLKSQEKWSDDTFVPFDYGYFSFIYNSEKLKNPPTSLKELVEQRDDINIIYQDPRTSTPGLGLMLWMKSVYGDEVNGAWQKLAKKTVTVTKGWSEAYNMFLEGEADMVLSYTTSPAYHIIAEGKKQYVAANFSEGHYTQTEVAAIVKGSKNKALATTFMNFMLSEGFQSEIATGNWMYPVTDIALPAQFSELTVPVKSLSFSSEIVAQKRSAWTKEWLIALTE
ncbi:thiamine transporter substrate binding subunit [Psychromonas marina]|uniref:Thiamine-binding periplasmic protein n=1 Tax=Psychromonas marina TaxID=88364 RepID=A0ABQ6E213_9GAMM|nr:thiamine transporter substrate binding subunit [Psychromonas marina]